MSAYKENHYVPQWYQKRFLPDKGEKKFRFLDLAPDSFVDARGTERKKKALFRWGAERCFKQYDLYTTKFGQLESTDIEQFFFGAVDDKGKTAVEYFANFDYSEFSHKAFRDFLNYLSIQKLRTPKGLQQLAQLTRTTDKNRLLLAMQRYQDLHCANWTEAVWVIAESSNENTGFIISDHPVTVYNRKFFPGSEMCKRNFDPDIWLNGTHTLFPLSKTKILFLTNLSWVRNPYGNPGKTRPNPKPFRSAIFNFLRIHTERRLSAEEVHRINYIIKMRAQRYVAAANEEWLYPEKHLKTTHWSKLDGGYLLMPDPRSLSISGEVIIGYEDGHTEAINEYGHRPWQSGYKDSKRSNDEWRLFHYFQGEYAKTFGPIRRTKSHELGRLSPDRDNDEFHQYHLSWLQKLGKPGKR